VFRQGRLSALPAGACKVVPVSQPPADTARAASSRGTHELQGDLRAAQVLPAVGLKEGDVVGRHVLRGTPEQREGLVARPGLPLPLCPPLP
jgi:hypothetical protein